MKISRCGLARRQMLFLVPLAAGRGGRTESSTLNDWAGTTDKGEQLLFSSEAFLLLLWLEVMVVFKRNAVYSLA